MARSTFAIFGILAVLLLGIGMVSAAVEGVSIDIKTALPTNVVPGNSYDVAVTVDNANGTTILLEWTNTSSSFNTVWTSLEDNSTMLNDTLVDFSATLLIPTDYTGSHLRYLKAKVYDNSTGVLLGTIQKGFTANSTVADPDIPGCTDDNYDNYDPDATVDDDSCSNDPVDIPGCTDDNYDNYDPDATVDDDSCANEPVSGYNFCEINGKVGDLKIVDVTFNNLGEGEDEDWYLLDEIEIEVEIENTHSSDNVKDVLVEIMILDDRDNDVTKDFDFDDEEINLNTIKDDDTEFAIFRIDEIPADLDSGRYRVYIKAYSEDEEDEQCVAEAASKYLDKELYQKIEVTREDDPAVIVKFDEFGLSASCGDKNVELQLKVYNLGSDKEESVLVTVQNYKLGINEKIVIDNLKSGKKKEVSVFFDVPKELSGSSYTLDIVTYYDFDEDEDELKESSYSEDSDNDLDKSFSARLTIESCTGPTPTINANLESTAEIGTNLIIKTLVTNNGKDNDFVFSVSDFESWADLVSVTPRTASIDEGAFIEITIILSPTASGTQSFKINAIVDGESYDQSVSVNIAKEPGLFGEMSDVATYIIIGIIGILVLIFLVLIAKVSRKSAKPQF